VTTAEGHESGASSDQTGYEGVGGIFLPRGQGITYSNATDNIADEIVNRGVLSSIVIHGLSSFTG
jgi:hypothetical protein